MAAELAHHAVSVVLAIALDGMADVADVVAFLGLRNAPVKAVLGYFQQFGHARVDFPDGKGIGVVAVVSVHFGSEIDGNDVAFAQGLLVGNPVYHLRPYRDAAGIGKSVQALEGRFRSVIQHELFGQFVQLEGRYARFDF